MKVRDIDGEEFFITKSHHGENMKAQKVMDKVEKKKIRDARVSLLREDYVSPYDNSMAVAHLVFIARRQMMMTHQELSEATGITYRRILEIEAGRSLPWRKEVQELWKALAIDPELFTQELEKAAESIRQIALLGRGVDPFGRRELVVSGVKLMKRVECYLPPKVRRWIEAESAVRGVNMASFASLLIMIMYRTAMDSYAGEDYEEEFKKVNSHPIDHYSKETYLLDSLDTTYFDEVDDDG